MTNLDYSIKGSIESVKLIGYGKPHLVLLLDKETSSSFDNHDETSLDDLVELDVRCLNFKDQIHYPSREEQFQRDQIYLIKQNEVAEYKPPSATEDEEKYESSPNNDSEIFETNEEAQETMHELQNATMNGTVLEISLPKRRKLSNHFLYDLTLANLFHGLHSLTDDVNYSYNS